MQISKLITRAIHFVFLTAFIAGFLTGCGIIDTTYQLPTPSGTNVTETTGFKAVVPILNADQKICTATFITPNILISAAHCVRNKAPFIVVVPNPEPNQTPIRLHIEKPLISYGVGNINDKNDIALLEIPKDKYSLPKQEVIPLATQLQRGETVTVVGFGCDDYKSKANVGKKRMGTNIAYSVGDMIHLLTPYSRATKRSVVGPSNLAGGCPGDSGGPLLSSSAQGYRLVGIQHSGEIDGDYLLTDFVSLIRHDVRAFLQSANQQFSLSIESFSTTP